MDNRLIKSLLFILTLSFLALGCKKDDNDTPSPTTYDFQAKVNGVLKQTNIVATVKASNFSIAGTFGDESISVSTDNPPSVGTFQLKGFDFDNYYSGRYDNDTDTYETEDGTGSGTGTITITKVTLDTNNDITELQATFSFTAYSGANSVSITEGVIDYK